MIATIVHVWVKSDKINDFVLATERNHQSSILETGNLRFDILQDASNPCKFTFYEAYESEEASVFHKTTDHYKEWRDSVADWMEKPREGVKHHILFPTDRKKW
jgi:(4S)-4-hydroxy-5-phosphonooxypentane-2,3-dione isomerase